MLNRLPSHTSHTSHTSVTDAVAGSLAEGWQAQLHLGFALRRGGSVLAHAAHEGPLRVQRAFFPEGQHGPCHVYVLHPPGGIVSGDRLLVDVRLEPHARALLTAPGANKLYRARGQESAT